MEPKETEGNKGMLGVRGSVFSNQGDLGLRGNKVSPHRYSNVTDAASDVTLAFTRYQVLVTM